MHFRFYYDVVCPYAYLASLRAADLAERTQSTIEWCPVLLGGLYKNHGTADVPADEWASNKVKVGAIDLLREAQSNGAAFQQNHRHPQRTVTAMRLIVAADESKRVALSQALYHAYWVDCLDINDPDVLHPIAALHGVDLAQATEQGTKDELRARTKEASDRGVFGVPTFEVDGTLWWGQDRMHLVEKALGGTPTIEPDVAATNAKTITFFHDFASPYSYLGATQIERVADLCGVDIEYKPILLGALFNVIGTDSIPMMTFGQAKQRYIMRDMMDWAQWWDIPFRFAPNFPIRSVTPLRVALLQPETTQAIYRAAWVDGINVGETDALQRVLDQAGFDGAALIAQTQDPAIKSILRANTEQAVDLGLCGVPTVKVGEQIFWGQDRLHRVMEHLRDN